MKKNLVVIHLESFNHNIYGHRNWFPCLNSISEHCVRLNNYISTATSSFMAAGDLLHGDDNILEHNNFLEVNLSVNRRNQSLFDELRHYGYNTKGIGYPKNIVSFDKIWSDNDKFHWYNNSQEMLVQAEKTIKEDIPFALYTWNLSSHLCYSDAHKKSGGNAFDSWRRGYESMDMTVGDIINLLIKYNKLKNTTVVIFGDHGDDFWSHAHYGGFSHGIEPYISLVHTPALILDPEIKGHDINGMVSAIDLKKTVLELLDLPYNDSTLSPVYSVFSQERKYCFSRNLFIAQANYPLHKGYSITSELFHLLWIDNEYKMFAWQADTGNHFDLICLLTEDSSGSLQINYNKLGGGKKPARHVTEFLPVGCENTIASNYVEMKQELENWVSMKVAAVKHA